jgi:Family of unknown function (DUF6544)
LNFVKVGSSLQVLPFVGGGSLLLAHLLTAAAFRRRTDAMFARLEYASVAALSTPSVQPIIQSFARRAMRETPVPKTVWLRQCGKMRVRLRSSWLPFTAEQVIGIHQPGFAWLARMQVAPLASACVLDCYVDGEGLLDARLFGSLPLARAAGPQADKGELMRYLAELAWAPHAMLHNPQLSWRGIDATTVEVSAESQSGAARVRLIFENGDITRVEADDRPRMVGRRIIPTRWQGRCCDYREVNGYRIPTRAVVNWLLADGPFEYWRARVTAFGIK